MCDTYFDVFSYLIIWKKSILTNIIGDTKVFVQLKIAMSF